jgi:acyl-CoA thioester hydrolase
MTSTTPSKTPGGSSTAREGGFSCEFVIRWSDADANGHVRHTVYPELGVEVRLAWLAAGGFSWTWFQQRRLGPVLRREEIDYLKELPLGAIVRVDLAALGTSPDGARWRLLHTFYKQSGEVAARVVAAGGWLDVEKRRLAAPPAELAAYFSAAPRADGYEELPALRPRE